MRRPVLVAGRLFFCGMDELDETPRASKRKLEGRRLKERALDLLSRRDHSERELYRKLKEKGGEVSELPGLMDELRGFGYLNDRRFAENFVRYRAGKAWGYKRFRQELLHRGVSSDIIDAVLSEASALSEEAVREKLLGLVSKEVSRGKSADKIMASLLRRGFRAGQVREAFEAQPKPPLR